MLSPVTYAAAIGRIHAVGSLVRVSVDRMVAALGRLQDGRGRRFRVWVPDDFSRVAVLATAPDHVSRTGVLDPAPQDAALSEAPAILVERQGELYVELAATAADERLAITVHALGRGRVDDDLAMLYRLAHADNDVASALADRARSLGVDGWSAGVSVGFEPPDRRRWSMHVALGTSAAARDAFVETATALAITTAQRNLLTSIHPMLAKNSAVATLHMSADRVERELTVTYHDIPFESVLRILIGIHPGVDHASRLGEIAGACGAERAAALSVELRDREPIGLRVGFDLELSAGTP